MPEYLSPGVYVEEFEIGAKPIEGVGTSTAGFLGLTERGPITPRLISSIGQFVAHYGNHLTNSYLAYAVDGFFRNGGQRCFICRIVGKNSKVATLEIGGNIQSFFSEPEKELPVTSEKEDFKETVDNPGKALMVKAIGPGEWGNRVAVKIDPASSGATNLFKLVVAYWRDALPILAERGATDDERRRSMRALLESANMVEVFDELSTDGTSQDNLLKKVNGISSLIEIEEPVHIGRPSNTTGVFMIALTGGSDGAAKLSRDDMRGIPNALPGERTGLTAFSEVDEIALLYAPDIHSPIFESGGRQAFVDDLLAECEKLKDRFSIIDVPMGIKDISGLELSTSPLRPSKYGAVYYPWIKVMDPITKREKLIPPGGHIAGIYARTDQERGVHKAPANELVRGAVDVEFQITKGEQDILNPRHINCIRVFPGRGILVWGARTTILDPLWKYINVRRLFIYLEESIEEGTQWVVFEPNNEKLWGRVIATITEFLTRVWKDGALMGTKPEEAFFVRCDRTTMTQDDIDNGRLICIIGVAPVKPAEFVVFRIAQWAGGSAITE